MLERIRLFFFPLNPEQNSTYLCICSVIILTQVKLRYCASLSPNIVQPLRGLHYKTADLHQVLFFKLKRDAQTKVEVIGPYK